MQNYAIKVRRTLAWQYSHGVKGEITEHVLVHSMDKAAAENLTATLQLQQSSGTGHIYGVDYNYTHEFITIQCSMLTPPCILVEDDTTVKP